MSEDLIGRDVEAYCGKCKEDTIHTITSIAEDKIDRVMCKICTSYHKFKKPAGLKTKSTSTKKQKKTTTQKTRRSRRTKDAKLLEQADFSSAVEYSIDKKYEVAVPIHHKTFGFGVVKNIIDTQKIEVIFQDCIKLMVQNYQA